MFGSSEPRSNRERPQEGPEPLERAEAMHPRGCGEAISSYPGAATVVKSYAASLTGCAHHRMNAHRRTGRDRFSRAVEPMSSFRKDVTRDDEVVAALRGRNERRLQETSEPSGCRNSASMRADSGIPMEPPSSAMKNWLSKPTRSRGSSSRSPGPGSSGYPGSFRRPSPVAELPSASRSERAASSSVSSQSLRGPQSRRAVRAPAHDLHRLRREDPLRRPGGEARHGRRRCCLPTRSARSPEEGGREVESRTVPPRCRWSCRR